jgi:CubicO group peptidase (beta-lactamase class C family)
MKNFETALPYEVGVDAQAILNTLERLEAADLGLHGFILVRHGKVFSKGWYAPYGAQRRHMLFSLTKSFTSTAVGFGVQEGLLTLEDKVVDFFPEKLPFRPCENMEKMRVKHLLNMCTGHTAEPAIHGTDPLVSFLRSYVDLEPGSRFLYNTSASCVLAYIMEKLTGMGVDAYLKPRLFDPLDITDYVWDKFPDGTCTGGFGLNLRTKDIAAFGKFLLQKGQWNGKQLLNSDWIDEATASHIVQPEGTADWTAGYGYQFWRCSQAGGYMGNGAFGQYCIIVPDKDLIIAVNSGSKDMQGQLDVFYEALIPGVHDGVLPENPAAQAALEAKIAGLTFTPPTGVDAPAIAGDINGKGYKLSHPGLFFEGFTLTFGEKTTLTLRIEGEDVTLPIGCGSWAAGAASPEVVGKMPDPHMLEAVETAGAWQPDGSYHLEVISALTPFITTMNLRFQGNAVEVRCQRNVGFVGGEIAAYGVREA